MSIQRYKPYEDHAGWTHGMDEANDGQYVRFSDYNALAVELADMRTLIAAAEWRASRIRELEAALRSVNAMMRAIIKRNQGGYIGDLDAVQHTIEVINAVLRPNAEGSSKIGKVHYSANDYEGITAALADLLRQVNKFCEEQGEAEFYTGNALAALGLSDNVVHLQTLNDLRSKVQS